MTKEMETHDRSRAAPPEIKDSCCTDPFAGLPPELRPLPAVKKTGLRQVTCPQCGLVYLTNRATDVCLGCS
jgi:hypothetical protein